MQTMQHMRHAGAAIARLALVLVLVASWQLAAFPAAALAATDAAGAGDGASSSSGGASGYEPTKLTLVAYQVLSDQDDFWDVKGGKKASIGKRGGQLRVAVRAKWSKDGDSFSVAQTDDAAWTDQGGFEEGFSYETSDADIARVDSRGIVTALGKKDGTVTVTATPKGKAYAKLSCSLKIKVANQTAGPVATKLEIVNAKGKAYGDDNVRITQKVRQAKLYARVTFADSETGKKTVYANYPGAPASQKPKDGALDSLKWSVGDTNYASISTHDGVGYLTGKANAVTQVFASISGGDASKDNGMGYGVLVDCVGVTIDNGRTVNGMDPADKLQVRVVYEKDTKSVVTKRTYTPQALEALGAVTRNYTLTRGNGKYVTDRAHGVPLAKLLVDLKIETDDVAYFTMAANDGANPGRITAKWLLKTTRYYLPNYDIGGSWQGRRQVPTMIALKDSWNEQTTLTGNMNTGTRFRLVFGSSTSSDNATDKSIKFINTLTVVMRGAPPSRHGKEDKPQTTKTGGTGAGTGAGSGSGSGSGAGAGAGTAKTGGSGDSPGPAVRGGGASSAQSQAEPNGGPSDVGTKDTAPSNVKKLDDSTKWRVYQMMNKSSSDLIPLDDKPNPLAPLALPAAIAVLAAAAVARLIGFRRKMRW